MAGLCPLEWSPYTLLWTSCGRGTVSMLVPSSQLTQIHMLDSALLKSLSVAVLYGVGLGFEDWDGG